MDRAIVVHPTFEPGRRIIVVSDIHGNLLYFQGLMERVGLGKQDILILNGDLLEKGRESLALLRYVMELSRNYTVYPLCGNCDGLVLRFFESDELDQRFFPFYLPKRQESIIRQLAAEAGVDQTDDLPRLRRDLRNAFPQEWAFLRTMPTVIETEHLVIVHGGVPSLDGMDGLYRWACMKNDDFLNQGHSFDKWVIVGHWPVTLYRPKIPSDAPLIAPNQKIVSIDGGCVLEQSGQLNALIIPEESSDEFTWVSYDGLPRVTALDGQAASEDSINIRWGRSALEMVEEGPETSLCRHLESGRVVAILNSYLHWDEGGLWCEDSTDYRLPVTQGDILALVACTENGYLCKKDGVTGWYFGRLAGLTEL